MTKSIKPKPTLLKMTLPPLSHRVLVSSPVVGLAGLWSVSSAPSLVSR